MDAILSKDDLLDLTELPWERVEVRPGKSIYVQGMSGTDRDAFEASLIRGRGTARRTDTRNVRARLAVRCLVDKPGGTRLYADSDIERLGKVRADVLQKIFEAAQRLSGVTDEDVEDLGKSSGTEAGDGSSST
jgi:hypothetical protein